MLTPTITLAVSNVHRQRFVRIDLRGLPEAVPHHDPRATASPHGPVRPKISNFSESLKSHSVIPRVNGGAGMATEMPEMDGGCLTVTLGVI